MNPGLKEIQNDPSWYLFELNAILQQYSLVHIGEPVFRQTSFLDQRVLTPQSRVLSYGLDELSGMFPARIEKSAATRFIFHVGHCGSTLLSRALGSGQEVLPLREPVSLRYLADSEREVGSPASFISKSQCEQLQVCILESLSRTFSPSQVPMIKMTSTCNNLLETILAGCETRRCLLMYITLESYLTAMLMDSAGNVRALDARMQAPAAIRDWHGLDEAEPFRLADLNHEQLLVLAWIMNMQQFHAASTDRSMQTFLLDFDDFLERPDGFLDAVSRFFGLADSSEAIVSRYAQIAGRYSKKPDVEYGASVRQEAMRATRKSKSLQIKAGMEWAEKLVTRVPALDGCERFFGPPGA